MDGAFSCVAALEALLLTQALAGAGNERQPNPDPGVAYIGPAGKILRSRFLLFQIQPLFVRRRLSGVPSRRHVSARIK